MLTFIQSRQKKISVVPKMVIVALVSGVILQTGLHAGMPRKEASVSSLPAPANRDLLQIISMGEPVTAARLLMLWLQAFDNQPGLSIPFAQLDYVRVIGWLENVLYLDSATHYPLLSAARVYAEVPDADKKRLMLDFVHKKFLEKPDSRWPWLAHAVFVARHRLQDLQLARLYARDLRLHTDPAMVPGWARQMELFVLEEIGEMEAAKILLGGLIDSGQITDAHEIEFLTDRLKVEQ